MKSKILTSLITTLAVVGMTTGTAFAWTYGLSGAGACQPDGSFLISWTVNNTTETDPLVITASNNTSVIAVGEQIPTGQTEDFEQTADGTIPGNFNLTISGNWAGEPAAQERSATVLLDVPCEQPPPPVVPPVTPPTGGRGGGEVAPPQVKAPTSGVSAGSGAAISVEGLLGLFGSVAVLGLGVRRMFARKDA